MTPCTVWRPRPGARVDPRADTEELRRTCVRDGEAEDRLLDLVREREDRLNGMAQMAINRITAVLRDGPPLCRCSRCGARFEAYRRYRSHKWARQCRQCSDRNRIKTQALSSR